MKNPFIRDLHYSYKLAYDLLPDNIERLLDFGCGPGRFISQLQGKVKYLYGCDPNKREIEEAKHLFSTINFAFLNPYKSLPFKNNYFDVITILGVIEHVKDEEETLKEIHRVLRPKGILILSTANKGFFSFADPGNFKFHFPRLHRFLYTKVFKKEEEYRAKFLDNSSGMYGDFVSREMMRHRHYSLIDLKKFFGGRFVIDGTYYYSLAFPIFAMGFEFFRLCFGKEFSFLKKVVLWDSRLKAGKLSFGLLIKVHKI